MTDHMAQEDEHEKLKRRLLKPYTEEERRQRAEQLRRELFGEVIFAYTDRAAVGDGVLIPFMVNGQDTRHRITGNAYDALKDYHGPRCPGYEDKDYSGFFFNELLPLVPEALRVHRKNGILTTDFDFRVTAYDPDRDKQLWYIPNELGGITEMLPSDY